MKIDERFTNEQKSKIIDMYNSGISQNKISKELDINPAYIHRILVNSNVKMRKQHDIKIPDSEVIKMLERISNGEKQYKIAKDYGIGPAAISRLLKRREHLYELVKK